MHSYYSKIIMRYDVKRTDGLKPLAIQCFINGSRVVISLNIYVREDQFKVDEQKIIVGPSKTMKSQHANDLNMLLGKAMAKASDIFIQSRMMDRELTREAFKEKFSNPASKFDFIDFMERQTKELTGVMSKGTIKSYREAMTKLKAFKPEISFADLNYTFVEDFNRMLIGKHKLNANTAGKHHKVLKKFIALANKRGMRIDNPYKDFKVVRMKGNRDFLNAPELLKLVELYNDNLLSPYLNNVLQYFLFSCFTGLRISDVKTVTWDNLINKELVFIPVKTEGINKMVRIPLNDNAIDLIPTREGKLFNCLSDQKSNEYLKEIAEMAGIRKRVTFHVARHTFATAFLRHGGTVEVLKELLGHAKIETTMEYVHIEQSHKREQMNLMKDIMIKKDGFKLIK